MDMLLPQSQTKRHFWSDRTHVVLISLVAFILLFHLFANALTSYGYFRDEFYYLACSKHLAWGYVDQPPFSIFLLALTRWLIGDSLFAIRLVPALAISITVLFTGLMVRRMGGGSVATLLACCCVVFAPIFLAMGTYYSINSLDMLLWAIGGYLLIRIVQQGSPSLWITLGVLMGIGLLNKVSFLWFGSGLLVALVLTPLRKQLATPWPYIAAAIAFLFFSPFIIWNFQHDFAHLEFMQNAMLYKYNGISRGDFLTGQLLLPNPASLPVWLSGLYYYFLDRKGRNYQVLGLVFLTAFFILLINGHSKAEYMATAYPMLFAGGGIMLEKLTKVKVWRWVPYGIAGFLIFSIVLSPLAMPLLPIHTFIAYHQFLGIDGGNAESKAMGSLPQFYADMFGWEELAADVSAVYQSLPVEEQKNAKIYANNYGEAGALQHYSKEYPLPFVMAGHNNYWLWGYGDENIQTVIMVGGNKSDHQQSFEEVEQVATHKAAYAMPYENNLPIFVCRKPRHTAKQWWLANKNYS